MTDPTDFPASVQQWIADQMQKAKIPHGKMTVSKARQRWEAVRQSAQEGDPAAMLDAVQKFQSIADLMLNQWSEQ